MNFCTIVSVEFLPSFLVAERSLAASQPNACVDVLCMDEWTERALERLDLRHVRLTSIGELESADAEFATTRAGRLPKEYCWTAKSVFALHLFDRHPEIELLTYVDSDIEFYADVELALEGDPGAAVWLYPQRMSPGWKPSDRHLGDFNGGTVTFRRSPEALAALSWWRERCIDWCYSHLDGPDRWADQKYLDTLAAFDGVTAVDHPGAGVAPWNARHRELELRSGELLVDGAPVIFYHFASLHLFRGLTAVRRAGLLRRRFRLSGGAHPLVWRAWEKKGLTAEELELFWEPYLARLGETLAEAAQTEPRTRLGLRDGRRVVVRESSAAAKAAARSRARGIRTLGRPAAATPAEAEVPTPPQLAN